MKHEWEYIGDGVYACYDGYHVWITVRPENDMYNGGIALEPAVIKNLIAFRTRKVKENEE